MNATVRSILNPGYFFSATSWEGALSTGSLAHMSPQEVGTYAGASEIVKIYVELQKEALHEEDSVQAYFAAHPKLSAEQMPEATERLTRFYRAEQNLVYVGPQMLDQVEKAVRAASR